MHKTLTLAIITIAMAAGLVAVQYDAISELGMGRDRQLLIHARQQEGINGSTWQYRMLPDFLLETAFRIAKAPEVALVLNGKRVGNNPVHWSWAIVLAFRFLQNTILLWVFMVYLEALGIRQKLRGTMILGWFMLLCVYRTDLAYSSYFDAIFFLCATLLFLRERYWWVVPLTALASLNRETALLIPIACAIDFFRTKKRPALYAALVGIAVCSSIFWGLHHYYPTQVLQNINWPEFNKGLPMLLTNLKAPWTLGILFVSLGVSTILILKNFKGWNPFLKYHFWVLGAGWILGHLFGGRVYEVRLLLVPVVLIGMPALLSTEWREG